MTSAASPAAPLAAYSASLFERVMRASGQPLASGMSVLDFGCGDGALVHAFADLGYDAHGCDFAVDANPQLRRIEDPYRLPFDDDSFDFVCSNQVFEHVMDYGQALSEIARVLRPTGRTLHFFPSRWRPVEPHVRVPLATVLRGRPWLRLWAAAGVRNEFQAGLTARQVAELNRDYLRDQTNYLGRSALEEHFRRAFGHVEFVERLIFNTSGRRGAATLSRVPLAMRGYSALVARLVLAGHGDR